MGEIGTNIKLSFQRALLGNISKHLRIICCDWEENDWIKVRFILDIEANEEEKELISCILADLETDLDFKKIIDEVLFSNESFEKIDMMKLLIFWRNELPIFS